MLSTSWSNHLIFKGILNRLYCSKHGLCIAVCSFSIFTLISITTGVLIVYLTLSVNTNKACKTNFKYNTKYAGNDDSRPSHVAVADLNRDQNLDLVAANTGTNNIEIFFGLGSGTFKNSTTYSTGLASAPVSVVIDDFNNDNLPDIAVANYGTHNIGIFFGSANYMFYNQTTFSLGPSRPVFLVNCDLNNDHYMDIVAVSGGTCNIVTFINIKNGSFRIDKIINMDYDSLPVAAAIADFNSDRQLDIAVVNSGTSSLSILLSNDAGTFTSTRYSTMHDSGPRSIAIGDFNNDTILDIAVANYDACSIGILLGYRNGTFANVVSYPIGSNSNPQFIVASYFDNDTYLDLAIIIQDDSKLFLYKGLGDGTFSIIAIRSTGFASLPISMAVGDFDNDYRPDIVIVNQLANSILVLMSYVTRTISSRLTHSTGNNSQPNSIAVGDFNHDIHVDVVVANSGINNIAIYLGTGDGNFSSKITYSDGIISPQFVAIADFNNDNNDDILVTTYPTSAIVIYLGYGNGNFSLKTRYQMENSYPFTVAFGHFNKDRHLDIVAAIIGTNSAGIFLGTGNGSFLLFHVNSSESDPFGNFVTVGDLNNDGSSDFAIARHRRAKLSIHFGFGNGSFGMSLIISLGIVNPSSVGLGDLNNDAILDIVFTDPYSSNIAFIFGYGNETFGSINTYSTGDGSYPSSIVLGYFDKGPTLDIAVINQWYFSIDIILGYGNGTFRTEASFSTTFNSFSSSITFADFNNDAQLDIAVVNKPLNTFHVFLIYHSYDFDLNTLLFTSSSSHPYTVSLNDFNRNNQMDMATANAGDDTVVVLFDYNEENFQSERIYFSESGSHPQYLATADINQDSNTDLVIVNSWANNLNILFNFGNGDFDEPTVHSTGPESLPNSVAIGKFKKFGWMDIAVANTGVHNIGVFLGFNYPTFKRYTVRPNMNLLIPLFVVTADINQDNRSDILVANSNTNTIDILLGYGNGTFIHQYSYSTGANPTSIALGDFNNDRLVDFAVSNIQDLSISIFLGYGNGTFSDQKVHSTFPSTPVFVSVGDLNQDHNSDIVVAHGVGDSIGIFTGYGNGTFAVQGLYNVSQGSTPNWIVINDLNSDNIPDIVVANKGNDEVGIFLGYGNGSFRKLITYSTEKDSSPHSIAVADLNLDGFIDIAVANQETRTVGILFGHGGGNFSSQLTLSMASDSVLFMIMISDLNNDKIPDLVVSDVGGTDGNISVFYGYGDGTFAVLITYSTGSHSYPLCFAIADFDNDARIDIAAISPNTANVIILLQEKSTPFSKPTIISTGNGSSPVSIVRGDFNNDNQLDIAVANIGMNNVGVFLGYGNGAFGEQMLYSTGTASNPYSIVVDDFNNDHQLDVAVANFGNSNIGILYGYGNGKFSLMSTYSTGTGSSPSSLAVADLNKDFQLDIVVGNFGTNNILVFFGLNNGTFRIPEIYSLNFNARPTSLFITDVNKDNLLDIVVANFGTNNVEILLQTC